MQIAIVLGCLGSRDKRKVLHVFSLKQGKISVLQKISVSERQRFPPQPFDLWFVECTEVEFRFKGKTGVHVSLLYYLLTYLSTHPSIVSLSVCLPTYCLCLWPLLGTSSVCLF